MVTQKIVHPNSRKAQRLGAAALRKTKLDKLDVLSLLLTGQAEDRQRNKDSRKRQLFEHEAIVLIMPVNKFLWFKGALAEDKERYSYEEIHKMIIE